MSKSRQHHITHNVLAAARKCEALLGDDASRNWLEKNARDPSIDWFRRPATEGRENFLDLVHEVEDSSREDNEAQQRRLNDMVITLSHNDQKSPLNDKAKQLDYYVDRFATLASKMSAKQRGLEENDGRYERYGSAADYAQTLAAQLEALQEHLRLNELAATIMHYLGKDTPKDRSAVDSGKIPPDFSERRQAFLRMLNAGNPKTKERFLESRMALSEALEKLIRSTGFADRCAEIHRHATILSTIAFPDNGTTDATWFKNTLNMYLRELLDCPAIRLAAPKEREDIFSPLKKNVEAYLKLSGEELPLQNSLAAYANMLRENQSPFQQAKQWLEALRTPPVNLTNLIETLTTAQRAHFVAAKDALAHRFEDIADRQERLGVLLENIIDSLQDALEMKRTLALLGGYEEQRDLQSASSNHRHDDVINASEGRKGSCLNSRQAEQQANRLVSRLQDYVDGMLSMKDTSATASDSRADLVAEALNEMIIAQGELLRRYPPPPPAKQGSQHEAPDPVDSPQLLFDKALAKQLHTLKEIFAFRLHVIQSRRTEGPGAWR